MKRVAVIPVVVGAPGTLTTRFEKYVGETGIDMRVEQAHETALLGTARI